MSVTESNQMLGQELRQEVIDLVETKSIQELRYLKGNRQPNHNPIINDTR